MHSVFNYISKPCKMFYYGTNYLIPKNALILTISGTVGWYVLKYLNVYLRSPFIESKQNEIKNSMPSFLAESSFGKITAYFIIPFYADKILDDVDKAAFYYGKIIAPFATIVVLNIIAVNTFRLKNIQPFNWLKTFLSGRISHLLKRSSPVEAQKTIQNNNMTTDFSSKSFFDEDPVDIGCNSIFERIYNICSHFFVNKSPASDFI